MTDPQTAKLVASLSHEETKQLDRIIDCIIEDWMADDYGSPHLVDHAPETEQD